MTESERKYFDALSESRSKDADALDRPNLRGVKKSIVDKYSDQAHFVYELIQNADDAGATEVTFDVDNYRLVFTHNGTRHFHVSNPDTEGEDYDKHTLGDINAITGIGLSSKPDSNKKGNAIGKFGMGFKSIFQYTSTPEIYDQNATFRITRQIVPEWIDHDFPGRKQNETVFVFPFDNAEARQPALDSLEKLNSLVFPTLFLNNLETITFNDADRIGEYQKRIVKTMTFEDEVGLTTCQRIEHTKTTQAGNEVERLLLFSRKDDENHRYAIGFSLDEEGRLVPSDMKAFCFFPTKHATNLKFLIHAPFLLTDSRETVKEFEEHNADMVEKLSDLLCSAILHMCDMRTRSDERLVDDDILKVIPMGWWGDSDFFEPFWHKTTSLFRREPVLPTCDGYVQKINAYWPVSKQISVVFPDEKLQSLFDDENIQWVFRSRWNDSDLDKVVSNFLVGCTCESPSEVAVLDRITPEFIEAQPISWLSTLYKWIGDEDNRRKKARKLPIFLDSQGNACSAFDDHDKHALFLPLEGGDGEYTTVHPDLLKDENARALLVGRYEIAEPDKAAHYRWVIEKKLPHAEQDELDKYLKPLLEYYFTLSAEEKSEIRTAIDAATDFRALNCKTGEVSMQSAGTLYFPTVELRKFFADCEALFFIDLDHYVELVGAGYREDVEDFFRALGTCNVPRIRDINLTWAEAHRLGVKWEYSTRSEKWVEKQIDGFHEILTRFDKDFDIANKRDISRQVWRQLQRVSDSVKQSSFGFFRGLREHLQGRHDYFYRWQCYESFDSRVLTRLRETEWVFGADGAFHRPGDLDTLELSSDYAEFGTALHSFLGIKEHVEPPAELTKEEQARQDLSQEDRDLLELGRTAREAGYTMEAFQAEKAENERLREQVRQLELEKARLAHTVSEGDAAERKNGRDDTTSDKFTNEDGTSERGNGSEGKVSGRQSDAEGKNNVLDEGAAGGQTLSQGGGSDPSKTVQVTGHMRSRPVSITTGRILDAAETFMNTPPPPLPDPFAEDDEDDDEQAPRRVDFEKKLREREQREAREIASIEHGEELQRKAVNATKYTFGWFKTMLDLEMLGNEKDAADKREVTIRFTRIEREPGTERTFVLKHPSRSLPQWLEELSGISLDMVFGKNVRAVIEVMSVQSYNLRVKLKSAAPLEGVDLATLREATVAAKSPDFLLTSLREGLNALQFDDDKSFKDDLTENLEFIFGPPGTGKTTFLATDRILPLMRRREDLKVLVLAPTNKAADVLAARVVEKDAEGSYSNWLVRFGSTGDEELEKTGVCKGKDVNLAAYPRHVVVTTIARFPYDFYIPGNASPQKLVDQDWDYIIIDEASMIPLVNIVYPLFRKERAHFIVAGDPFQIEPIISNDLWKDENIYTMVGLDDFASPKTKPRSYPVKKLTTQYRSVPAVGKIFSAYRYGGILSHARTPDSIRLLEVGEFPEIRPLTIVKFPVSPYESVYRTKRLGLKGGSSYQIYSALLAFEFVCGLARSMLPQEKPFRIGVISPYRAQASLVQRLLESQTFPEYVRASASTVHGFQGDECEMIVSLFNPPPGLSGRKGSFINKKNIINVSVSRARDYLVLLMPDDRTENLENMFEVRKIEALMRLDPDNLIVHEARDIEAAILGSPSFIEDNTFSTGHQMVNVYGVPEQRYEVRTDDGAVDVQLHLSAKGGDDISNVPDKLVAAPSNSPTLDTEAIAEGFARLILIHHKTGIVFDDKTIDELEKKYGHALNDVVRLAIEHLLFKRSDGVWLHPEAVMPESEQASLANFSRNGMFGHMSPFALNNVLRSKMRYLETPVDLRGFLRLVKSKYGVA